MLTEKRAASPRDGTIYGIILHFPLGTEGHTGFKDPLSEEGHTDTYPHVLFSPPPHLVVFHNAFLLAGETNGNTEFEPYYRIRVLCRRPRWNTSGQMPRHRGPAAPLLRP